MQVKQYPSDYLAVCFLLAYSSNALEGNTLSLGDTNMIINPGHVPGSESGHSLREIYEATRQKKAFDLLLCYARDNREMSLNLIRETHRCLPEQIQTDSGKLKQFHNEIVGTVQPTALPGEVPALMAQWVDNLNERLNGLVIVDQNLPVVLPVVLSAHIQFEKIHPFSDSNGRTGRLLMNYPLLCANQPLIVIPPEMKPSCIDALQRESVGKLTTLVMH